MSLRKIGHTTKGFLVFMAVVAVPLVPLLLYAKANYPAFYEVFALVCDTVIIYAGLRWTHLQWISGHDGN
jgi:hypothetical protein